MIYTDHSITVPPDVEIVRASTHRAVTLRGGDGNERLIGSNGNDTLISGPGSDYLNGGGGRNTLVLGPFGFAEARGGPGGNRFVVKIQPVDPALSIGMATLPIAAWTADVIDDFHVGDRLVLSTRSFGSALRALRGRIRITVGATARGGGAQFVFYARRGLLSFDPDGHGPAPSVGVAILKGRHKLSPAAIQIVGP
ncbi:hypothetical protein AYO39_02515 [Actinobacteria bacterium SCGC AG-212-D09]|nr:hypothetical protein AYO39_02515 [Actinobacteria bacterium SCGC AG-212-D09]